ncbi:ChaN family lipoprotein [Polaromonas jejuensis]|uniref:ChaN family lipoprotein n=1 Tax=Polaromonas jejuensis TaxID=457502 RepID=A0ABW0QBM5_9BURK|nr:ChaN family lipoprotein [Polaromonas jejuensis]
MAYLPLPHAPAWLICAASLALAGGCTGRLEAPILGQPSGSAATATAARLDALLPADVLLLGEQHDAPDHQHIEQQVVALLSSRGQLAAVALEMADTGLSTATLGPGATEEQVRQALKWNDKGWPWAAYGPAVMTAVRADVPVLGANLPRVQMQGRMADSNLDIRLPEPALKAQQQAIRLGHCNLLPESQITPMARIQIAKDISMADAIHQAALPGRVVVLLTGSGHADRNLGVPRHLPTGLKARAVHLRSGDGTGHEKADAFDDVWSTPVRPATDYCATLRQPIKPGAASAPETQP